MADTDYDAHTVEVLNHLYSRHRASLLPRLREMHNFVSRVSARDVERASGLAADFAEHERWLAHAIDQAGGGVYPSSADIQTGNLHYLELHAVMPLVERNLQSLLAEFEKAQADPRLTHDAREAVTKITGRLRRDLEEFTGMKERLVQS